MTPSYRRIARERAVIAIYQWLLTAAGKGQLTAYIRASKQLKDDIAGQDFAMDIINNIMLEKENYIVEITPFLKEGWTFERLSYVEQAILLVAVCELKTGELDKRIIIDEAVECAKKYCDADAYRYINGILTNF